MKPKLIILTGPQGSGNHMWSKIFALHPKVVGWKELLDTDWIGHEDEPFNGYWQDTSLFEGCTWYADYYVTSISCPYIVDGELTYPDYKGFVKEAEKHFDIRIVVLGRDPSILEYQQTRLRGKRTSDDMVANLDWITSNCKTTFASMELLHLYGYNYLSSLSAEIDFPISYFDPRLAEILQENPNSKYVSSAIGTYDEQVRKASGIDA